MVVVTSQCICDTLTPMMLQFTACIWHARSQQCFNCASYKESAQGQVAGGQVTSDDGASRFAFEQQYVKQPVHLPVYPHKVIKWGGGGGGFKHCYLAMQS